MNLIIFLVIIVVVIMGVMSVIAAINHITTQAKDDTESYSKYFSVGQKKWLRIVLLSIFLGICGMIFGIMDNNGTIGTIGILLWVIASLIAAYTCSPLRLITENHKIQSKEAGAYYIYFPVFIISSLVSLLVIMFISWVYVLRAIHRRSPKE